MELIDNIPVSFSVEQVLNRLRLDNSDKFAGEIQNLIEQVQDVARPKAIYDVCYIDSRDEDSVDIASVRFTSRILSVNLGEAERVFPHVATCGREVESIDIPPDDLMGRFILDIIKQMALSAATKHLREYVDREHKPGKMSAMAPGSLEDWPISEQKQLFSLFGDVESLIGVELTDTFLMLPLKSVSGMYFPTEITFESCQLCPRERCPGRRAQYDEKVKERYF
ncbi:vitamin B12 dependent-methionine synthase activation domain-containing protein [Candidatus Poribacteria bacterium]